MHATWQHDQDYNFACIHAKIFVDVRCFIIIVIKFLGATAEADLLPRNVKVTVLNWLGCKRSPDNESLLNEVLGGCADTHLDGTPKNTSIQLGS